MSEARLRDEDAHNGIATLVRGNAADARELRANIVVFARRLGDPTITRMVNEVLRGQRNVRDVFRTPQFNEVGLKNVAMIERGLDELTPDERERVLSQLERDHDDDVVEESEGRLNSLRAADLGVSPVDQWGEVHPDPERPLRR